MAKKNSKAKRTQTEQEQQQATDVAQPHVEEPRPEETAPMSMEAPEVSEDPASEAEASVIAPAAQDEAAQAIWAEPEAPNGSKSGTPRRRKAASEPKEKKRSALDAAAKVLAEEERAMGCQELIEAMAVRGYWTSPKGATPHATLYSAMLREVSTKGAQARFTKAERGKFALNRAL